MPKNGKRKSDSSDGITLCDVSAPTEVLIVYKIYIGEGNERLSRSIQCSRKALLAQLYTYRIHVVHLCMATIYGARWKASYTSYLRKLYDSHCTHAWGCCNNAQHQSEKDISIHLTQCLIRKPSTYGPG